MKKVVFILLPVLALSMGACTNEDEATENAEVYEVRGRYLSSDIAGEYISVIHEEIPDVMQAMRMNLRIDDPGVAESLETGDIISFDMVRTERGWFARNIEILPDDAGIELPEELRDVGAAQ